MPSSARGTAEALEAALSRIALLERRELALRAALATAGVDPDAVLARLDLLESARAPAPVVSSLPERQPAWTAPPPAPAPAPDFAGMPTDASRSLARRLAEEVVSGPATLRLRAAIRLVEVAGQGAVPALLAAAHEAEGAVRASLIEQVGRCGDAQAAEELAEFLADETAEVRAAAIEAMVRLVSGAELEAVLRMGLEDGDARVRRRTALCAASARNFDAGALLVPLLSDPDRQVRRVACTALGGSRDPMAALALVGALLDDEAAVRTAAGTATERLFGEQARGISQLPAGQRPRAVARLRSWVAANLVRLAPGGRMLPAEEPKQAEAAPLESVLDELMATGHAGAGFEDDLPGWTEENDPELHAAFARMAGAVEPWAETQWAEAPALEDEAASIYAEAEEAWEAAGIEAAPVVAFEPAEAIDEPVATDAIDEPEFAETLQTEPDEEPAAAEADDALAAGPTETPGDDAAPAQLELGTADEAAPVEPEPAPEDEAPAAEAAAPETIDEGEAAPEEVVAAEAEAGPGLEAIEEVLRAALRGCPDAARAGARGWNEADLAPVVEAYLADGRLVRRGRKLFLP